MEPKTPNLNSQTAKQIGIIQQVFAPKRLEVIRFWVGFAAAPLFFVGAVVPLGLLLFDPPRIPDKLLGLYITSGIFGSFFLAFVILLPFQWRWMRRRFIVGENGVVFLSPKHETLILWPDLKTVFKKKARVFLNGAVVRVDVRFTLQSSDGAEIVVTSYLIGIHEFEDRLDAEILKRKLSVAKDAVQDGNAVKFGPLSVSRDGIRQKDDDMLPWQEVKSVELADGSLVVSKEGAWRSWCKVALDKIPNLVVFLAVLDSVAGDKFAQPAPA